MFLLESSVLVLLHRESGYGYSLMAGMEEFGFKTEDMDISVLYRALRELEADALVTSSWSEDSLGPQRRMYTITAQGEASLGQWMQALHQRRMEIESLEAAYAAIKQTH